MSVDSCTLRRCTLQNKPHREPCQVVSSEDVAKGILKDLGPSVAAAAREVAESGSGGRGGGGSVGASMSWVLAPFSSLFKFSSPKDWACKDDVLLRAAHLVVGGSAELSSDEFEGTVPGYDTPVCYLV